jgi:hypothetical protein
LKADVTAALDSVPTVGCAGLGWKPGLDVVQGLNAQTVRLAFDADARTNAHVARALADCYEEAVARGLAVELERWDPTHKGIDDALAAGAAIEILSGDAAQQAVVEIAAVHDPLKRLDRVLKEAGAEGLYKDKDLLEALAQLAEKNPGEFACWRAKLQRSKVRLRDLDAALAPLRKAIRQAKPPPDRADMYRVAGGRIIRDLPTKDGTLEVPLCNFAARVAEQVSLDDGADRSIRLAVEGALQDGTPLARVEIAAEDFPRMDWTVGAWGTRPCILAGMGNKDHIRAALQLLSGDVPQRTVYGHLGWRQFAESWRYLHAAGAIGADGPVEDVEVSPPEALSGYILPAPPEGEDRVRAVRASLNMLALGPDRVSFALLAAVYRAVLAACDFTLHLCGPTGAGKTERAALAQQHFGAGLDARHLPGSWSSTGNSLETLAFACKDGLLSVDDFAPGGSNADVARIHREADRLLRAQGNRSGRSRCRTDGTVRPARPPRGLVLSTGEDIPRGQSLRSRLLVLETSREEMDWEALTKCQRNAAEGLYAQALAGFIQWLAPRYGEVRDHLATEHAGLRDAARAEGQHARTPGIVADLGMGFRRFLEFAQEVGAIDAAEREALWLRGWKALGEAAETQADHVEAAEPTGLFLRLLAAAVASEKAHVAGPKGDHPAEPAAWGWRLVEIGTGENVRWDWQAKGTRIGWVDGEHLFLEPEAAYAAAQALAREQGESLPVAPRTLYKRLHERGLLAAVDQRGCGTRYTVRRTLNGRQRAVICLLAHSPYPDSTGQTGQNPLAPPENKANSVASEMASRPEKAQKLATATGHSEAEGQAAGGNGQSGVASNRAGEPGLANELANENACFSGDSTPNGQFGQSGADERAPRDGKCTESQDARGGRVGSPIGPGAVAETPEEEGSDPSEAADVLDLGDDAGEAEEAPAILRGPLPPISPIEEKNQRKEGADAKVDPKPPDEDVLDLGGET